ncbi:MAG: MOSC domain-containing protein [Pseudomonadota bacterium]
MTEVIGLKSYPVKGLSPTNLTEVAIRAGEAFPNDRIFGLARSGSIFNPEAPRALPKDKFWVLAQEQRLAHLSSSFDPKTMELVVDRKGGTPMKFDLGIERGKEAFENFIVDFLNLPIKEKPRLFNADHHRFTDVSVVSDEMMHAISLINLDSVQKLEADTGLVINPERFRGNIMIDNMPAFSELDLVGKHLKVGEILFEVVMKTKRCPATEVNPVTAERDVRVPYLLKKHYDHFDMGVYMIAKSNGMISLKDKVVLQ